MTTDDLWGTGITVVIPVWGAAYLTLLDDAAASVRDVLPGAALVVVDNGNSPALEATVATTVVRLPYKHSLARARAAGLARVTTPHVVFLDADDALLPGARRLWAQSRAHDAVVLAGALRRSTEAGVEALSAWPPRYAALLARVPVLLQVVNAARPVIPVVGAAVLRTDTVRDVGVPELAVDEDWLLSVLLSRAGRVRLSLDALDPALLYRTAPGTLSRQPIDPAGQLAAHRVVLDTALAGLPASRLLLVVCSLVQRRVRWRRRRQWGVRRA